MGNQFETQQQPLSEVELDQLELLLEAPGLGEQAMRLDELQAFLCAVVSGPDLVPASVWLPEVLGLSEGESLPEVDVMLPLILRFYNQILEELSSQDGVAPLLYPLEEDGELLDYESWADAYLFGAQMGAQAWQDAAGEHWEELSGQLEVLFLLNGALKEDVLESGEKWVSPAEEERWLADARESLPDLVQAIYDFWAARKAMPGTIQRETPKVGRNDPCPCGSGRKYKQCCGNQTLH